MLGINQWFLAFEKCVRYHALPAIQWYKETRVIAKTFKAKPKIYKLPLHPVFPSLKIEFSKNFSICFWRKGNMDIYLILIRNLSNDNKDLDLKYFLPKFLIWPHSKLLSPIELSFIPLDLTCTGHIQVAYTTFYYCVRKILTHDECVCVTWADS